MASVLYFYVSWLRSSAIDRFCQQSHSVYLPCSPGVALDDLLRRITVPYGSSTDVWTECSRLEIGEHARVLLCRSINTQPGKLVMCEVRLHPYSSGTNFEIAFFGAIVSGSATLTWSLADCSLLEQISSARTNETYFCHGVHSRIPSLFPWYAIDVFVIQKTSTPNYN